MNGRFDPKQPGISAEIGETHWLLDRATASDLNHAMREAAGPYVDRLRQQFDEIRRQSDLALIAAVAAKYGKQISDCDAPASIELSQHCRTITTGEGTAPEQLSIFNSGE